ncbi:MAG: hypothetical protein HZC40_12370 [Chloroflexi bacterium]|nr:hypothetical protein [Chloroflexota bacterium]
MAIEMRQIAHELAISEDQVAHKALRALVRAKIHAYNAERRARCAKFGVTSLQEMDALIRAGKIAEDEILDDFQNVDYLTSRVARLQQLLGETV